MNLTRFNLKICGLTAFIFIASAMLMFQRFTDPWTRIDDANSLIYSFYAKNLLRYPASVHKFLNIDAVSQPPRGQIVGEPFSYYLDHSPMLTYLVAGFYWLFGISEGAARLAPILSSLGSLATLFYFVWRWTKSYWISLTSLIIMAFTPLFVEQSQIVNFEPLTLFFSLLGSCFLIEGYWQGKKFYKTGGYLIWFLAMLVDWPATFLALPLFIFISLKKRNWELWLPILFPFLANSIVFWLNSQATPQLFSALMSAVFFKQNSYSFLSIYPSLLPTFFQIQLKFFVSNYTIFPFIGSFLWLVSKWYFRRVSLIEVLALFFFAVGSLNVLMFPSWSSTHRYWTYYFLPFATIATSLVCYDIWRRLPKLLSIGMLGVTLFLFLDFSISTIQKRIFALEASPSQITAMRQIAADLSPKAELFTTQNIYVLGSGRRIRYYLDRPIKVVKRPLTVDTFPLVVDKNSAELLDQDQLSEGRFLDQQLMYFDKPD